MIESLTAADNWPFALALGLLALIGAIEVVGLLAGSQMFGFLEGLAPDVDVTVDAGVDAGDLNPTWGEAIFNFLGLGKVPLIFSLLLWLFLFGFGGLLAQAALSSVGLGKLPWWFAGPAVFLAVLPPFKLGNFLLAKIMPKDETSAESPDSFVGRVAVVTLGTVTAQRQSEARLTGAGGGTHYVQVIADNAGDTFRQGDAVLLVSRRSASVFTVIAAPAELTV